MPEIYTFYVNGITCGVCSGTIKSYIEDTSKLPILDYSVDLTAPDPKEITVVLDSPHPHRELWEKIRTELGDGGYPCEEYDYLPPVEPEPKPQQTITSHWFLGALGCSTGFALLFASSLMTALPFAVMTMLAAFSILLTFILGADSYSNAWRKLFYARSLNMDTLYSIGTLTILVVSLASLFVPWLPMMFESSLLIYGFKHIGIAIKDSIKEKTSPAKFQNRAPKEVCCLIGDQRELKSLDLILPGEIILIGPGEIIPLDGHCEETSHLYNTILKGSNLPRQFNRNEEVLAGMKVSETAFPTKIRVSKTAKDSYLAQLDENIERLTSRKEQQKEPIEKKIDHILTYFIPGVIALAIISGTLISLFFPAGLAIQCAISILISICPCTLGLAIPLAVETGVNKGKEYGIQCKKSTIQQLDQIDTVVFDLNGTLTRGKPQVTKLVPLDNMDPEQLLSLCSALEKESKHLVGKAIIKFARNDAQENTPILIDKQLYHSGITGKIDGNNYAIGSKSLMSAQGIAIPAPPHLLTGDSLVYIAREQQLIGYFIITDPLRSDAIQTIGALRKMNKEIHLCTGADAQTAERYAQVLGINTIHADCIAITMAENARSKQAYIAQLKTEGKKVAMVGDGGNDAPAMAESDVGIAIPSEGSDKSTRRCAEIIIQKNALLPIINAFTISNQTAINIKQNLIINFAFNFISVLLASGLILCTGIPFPPALGALLMTIQTITIYLNVNRFKNQALELEQEIIMQEVSPAEEQLLEMKEDEPHYLPLFTPLASPQRPTVALQECNELIPYMQNMQY